MSPAQPYTLGLSHFAARLREQGVPVSTGELVLAAEALRAVPDLRRATVQSVLRACLVKRAGDRARFDALFEAFFEPGSADGAAPGVPPRRERGGPRPPEPGPGAGGGAPEDAPSAPSSRSAKRGAAREPERDEADRESEDAASDSEGLASGGSDVTASRDDAERGEDHEDGDDGDGDDARDGDDGRAGEAPWTRADRRAAAASAREQRGAGRGDARDASGSDRGDGDADAGDSRAMLERALGLALDGIDERLLALDLTGPVAPQDQVALLRVVDELVSRLATRAGRRRVAARRGSPDLRRILRRNLAHDGVLALIPRRRRRPKPARLVLLCDVSGSVRSVAALLLRLCRGVSDRFERTRVLAFVDAPVELDARALAALLPAPRDYEPVAMPSPAELAARELRRRQQRGTKRRRAGWRRDDPRATPPRERPPPWGWSDAELPGIDPGRLSDFGNTFWVLSELGEAESLLDRRTTLVVLGDGRSNHFDPMAWSLEAIREQVREVLWLVPEPRRDWDTGDSVLARYAPHVDRMLEATTLAGLLAGLLAALPARRRC